MFDFAEKTSDMTAIEILNYYRNLYYAEPQITERGIIANAINEIFNLINRQRAEIDNLNKQMEWLTGYNGNLMSANTALSEEILLAKTKAYKEFAERLKEEFLNLQYNAKTNRKTVKIEELKKQMDWLLHTVAIETLDNLLKEMVGEEE